MCFSKDEAPTLFDNLGRPLDLNNVDHCLWNDKCDYVESHEINNLNLTGNNLIVLQLNIRSLLGKQHALLQFLDDLSIKKSLPKLILLSETHLNESKIRHLNIPNYNLLYHNRITKSGGGVAILIHNSIMYKERPDLTTFNSDTLECIFLEMNIKGKQSILVGSLYRAPSTNPKKFNQAYDRLVNKMIKENKEIILGMDHNLNLLKSSTHTETQSFIDINFDHYLFPCITRPTRITNTSATLIDNIFISQKLHNSFDACIVVHDLSDHLPSIINLHDQLTKVSGHMEFKCRSLNKNKLESINRELRSTDWTNLNNSNVNTALDEFQSKIEDCLDSIAPLKLKKIPIHKIWREQWITKGISNSMRKCTNLYKQSIKINASPNTVHKYKLYRNCLTRIKRKARIDYYTQQCYALKSNTKKLWQLINKIINKTNDKESIINYITVDNIRYYEAKSVADEFGKFYSTVGLKLTNKIHETNPSINDYLSNIKTNPNTMYLHPITPTEILRYIDRLPSKNSSGHDSISNIFLKAIKHSIKIPLTQIFNLSISTGVFPENMKIAEVIPLFKKGALDNMENYRPISLLITISKLLEKSIYKRLYNFINNNNIFYSKQYGFRSNHSCEQAIQDLYGQLINSKEEGLNSISIFLDLSKAFDTLPHELLLKKLNIYGIRGLVNNWFKSYLTNRKLYTKCKTLSSNKLEKSKQYLITHGTAQGSCLGPLLFNIFCNDIYLNIRRCKLILFADDTTLHVSHRNMNYLTHMVQEDMKNLDSWFKANKLSLNTQKSVVMVFLPRTSDKILKQPIIKIDTVSLPVVSQTKFLGITIDNKLSWKEHINNIIRKISINKILIGKSRNLMTQAAKRNIYYAHIYPHLTYANTIWSGHTTAKQRKKINTIQKYCVRAITNKSNSYHTDPMFNTLKIMKFDEIEKFELCKLLFCVKEKLIPAPIYNMFNTLGEKTHGYNTRYKNVPNIKKHTSTEFNKSFLCKGITCYSQLNGEIKKATNKTDFIRKYKLNLYNTNIKLNKL